MANAKIIGIHDGKHIETDTSVRPLPMPIIKLRDETKEQIKTLLRQLFDNADDALFAMADKAGTNGDQTVYFDSMRELRLQKKYIANSFLQQVIHSFNNVNHLRDTGEDRFENDDLESLSLLKNDELEISVALEGMVSRLRNNANSQLDDLHKRIESLVQAKSIKAKHVPASPEVLCDAFAFASSELEVDLKAKLIIFKLFERYVLNEMSDVYQQANHTLAQLGILPNLKKQKYINPNTASASSRSDKPQQDVPVLGKEQSLSEGQFEQIRMLMHTKGFPTGQPQASYGSNVVFLNQDQLVSTLTRQQLLETSCLLPQHDYQPIDFRQLIESAYVNQQGAKQEGPIKYSEIDNDIINLVSMLFDFILDDRQLQPTMKALISRLQIPILKVALMDKTFFDRGGHPARKLLNEMASAAIGWSEKASGQSDRLKAKIESVVEQILGDFETNLDLFDDLLLEFTQFTDLESRRGQLIEQRTKDTEKGKAATELAKKISEATINTVIQAKEFNGQEIPDCVITLLTEGWSRVMILDFLKLGEESSEWKGHQRFIYDLLWTVCPSEDGSEARGKLLQLIPMVMRRIRQGLQEVSFDELRLNKLLAELEKHHIITLKHLHKRALAEQDAAAKEKLENLQVDDKQGGREQVVAEQHQQESYRKSLDIEDDFKAFQEKLSNKEIYEVLNRHEASQNSQGTEALATSEDSPADSGHMDKAPEPALGENDPFMQQVSRLAVGGWFEFSHSGKAERAKLAAFIKVNGHYIFVNRSGVKVAEKTKLELATEMKAGLIQVLNDGLLFDRALESIISNLRA